MELKAEDLIIRSKVQLQSKKPFFSYLIMYMKITENNNIETCGVDMMGNMVYNSKWIESLKEAELNGVLSHEVMHIILHHLERTGGRDRQLFNVANDLVVNDILIEEGFRLPEGLVPSNHSFTFKDWNVTIEKLNEKTSEQVYEELYKKAKKQKSNGSGKSGKGSGSNSGSSDDEENQNGKGFDKHIYGNGNGKDDKGKELSPQQAEAIKNKWKQVLAEASNYAKQRGLLPAGMERLIDGLLESKVDWRHKLYRFMTNQIMYDFTYSRPHKKSISTGVYMPSILREKIEIVVHIDTSGSIGQKELTEFVSEICSIARSFNNITMDLIFGDAELQGHYEVSNGNIDTIMNMKIKGGGGTSHSFVKTWLEENKPNCKCLISLTDGFSDIQSVYPEIPENIYKLIVMPVNSEKAEELEKYAEIVKLD